MAAHRPAPPTHLWAAASVTAAAFLFLSPVTLAIASKANDWQRASQSWALGIVVPEGAELSGGVQLSWGNVRNVTALARLPSLSEPNGVTYLVLSAEGDDGTVLQIAAGVWPGCTTWSAYSWYITGIGTGSTSYRWVMNASAPSMTPGDRVSISISVERGMWKMSIRDLNTSEDTTGRFPSPALARFATGDQEVFALESYTWSASTFVKMGNATLLALLADGDKMIRGWYVHGGWDPSHSPLFEVGSAQPPSFISLAQIKDGEIAWNYDAQWTAEVWNTSFQPIMLAYGALAALVPVAFLLGRRLGRVRMEGAS